jgi:hypothetical protein
LNRPIASSRFSLKFFFFVVLIWAAFLLFMIAISVLCSSLQDTRNSLRASGELPKRTTHALRSGLVSRCGQSALFSSLLLRQKTSNVHKILAAQQARKYVDLNPHFPRKL